MRKLSIGCGTKFSEGYEHLDRYVDADFIDYKCDAKDVPVEDETFDEIYARHFLEHLFFFEAVNTLAALKKKLKIGGCFHIIVPNLTYHAKQLFLEPHGQALYVKKSTNLNHAIAGFYGWTKEGKEYMQHKHGYTKESMEELINSLGLKIEWHNRRDCDLELKAFKV